MTTPVPNDASAAAERLEQRRAEIARDAERADRIGGIIRRVRKYARKILFFASLAAGYYLLTTFSIIHSKNAPLPPGFGWQESAWMLVQRSMRTAADLNRNDLVAYGFNDHSGAPTVAAALVVGLPGDTVSFRRLTTDADPSDPGAALYRIVVNEQLLDGRTHPAFEQPLTGPVWSEPIRVSPGHLCVINPATVDAAGPVASRGGAAVDSRAWGKNREIPETIVYGKVLLPGRLAQ